MRKFDPGKGIAVTGFTARITMVVRIGIVVRFGIMVLLMASLASAGEEGATMKANDTDPSASGLQFLFIHHSCGGQLLATPGQGEGEHCIYESHPNGGGLRQMLQGEGFAVNEASYGSIVGQDTDICHWHQKFATQMERILRTRYQDEELLAGLTNNIVAFKSCFPNNKFVGKGQEPGDPDSCDLTVTNARAAYNSLLPLFEQQPEVLFVAFTAPPPADYERSSFKRTIKNLLGRKPEYLDLARDFNAWLADGESGWLADYPLNNVVVFDHYGVLTNQGDTEWSAYPSGDGHDSHPSSDGNQKAARALVEVLNGAVARMGWTESADAL